MQVWRYLDSSWGMMARPCDTAPKLTTCGVLARNGGKSTAWIDPRDRECTITSASDERPGVPMAQLTCSRRPAREGFCKFANEAFRVTWRPR
jgi:hypothetical protein